MVKVIDSWMPRDHRETVRMLVRDIDRVIAGFMRGQAVMCLILCVFYCVPWSIGVRFGLLIGSRPASSASFPMSARSPGLRSAAGGAGAVLAGWTWPIVVLAIFVVGQMIEGNVLQPALVGKTIGLHPVWLMFALLAFGYLFGFVGLLIAVPVAAAIGVLARFAISQYIASPLYTGDS